MSPGYPCQNVSDTCVFCTTKGSSLSNCHRRIAGALVVAGVHLRAQVLCPRGFRDPKCDAETNKSPERRCAQRGYSPDPVILADSLRHPSCILASMCYSIMKVIESEVSNFSTDHKLTRGPCATENCVFLALTRA